ncbi:unnamed protein product, partial [Closterium sp. NIES-53]
DGVSLLGHMSRSLPATTTPTEPAADADEDVQRRYRADSLAYRQWTERDAVAQRAVRSLLLVDQRDHFRQVSSLGACEPGSTVTAPVEAIYTFILDPGATHCFFRDCTTVTPLTAPVSLSLNDPSGGPVVARASTILPCRQPPQAPSQISTSPRSLRTCPGSGLYTLTTESAQNLLWHHCLGHPSLPCLRGMHSHLLVFGLPKSLPPLPRSLALPCLPCVKGRQLAAPHSSFPPTTAPLQTLHMDVWGPARVRGQDQEH